MEIEITKGIPSELKKGFYVMSDQDYSGVPAIRHSTLSRLSRSPAHYQAAMDSSMDSDAMRFGRMLHCLALEPEKFWDQYAVSPKFDGRTKAGKEGKAKFESENEGKVVVKNDDYSKAKRMVEAIMAHPEARKYFEDSWRELVAVAYHQESDQWIKCKMDIMGPGFLADVKSTQDASLHGFKKSVANFNYYTQAAFYLMICRELIPDFPMDFRFIAVEKECPHHVGTYTLDEEAITHGSFVVKEWLYQSLMCRESGEYPGYGKGELISLGLPAWMTRGGE